MPVQLSALFLEEGAGSLEEQHTFLMPRNEKIKLKSIGYQGRNLLAFKGLEHPEQE